MTKFNVLFSILRNRYANSLAPSSNVCIFSSREYELAISLLALQLIDQLVQSTQISFASRVTFLVNSRPFLLSGLVGNNRFFKVFVKFYQYCQANQVYGTAKYIFPGTTFPFLINEFLEPLSWQVLKHVDMMMEVDFFSNLEKNNFLTLFL